jgi:hypothetical protein
VFVNQDPDRETFHNCLSRFMIFLLHSLGVLRMSLKEGMHRPLMRALLKLVTLRSKAVDNIYSLFVAMIVRGGRLDQPLTVLNT